MHRKPKWSALIIGLFLMLGCVGMLYSLGGGILIEQGIIEANNLSSRTMNINWEELYPFQEQDDAVHTASVIATNEMLVGNEKSLIRQYADNCVYLWALWERIDSICKNRERDVPGYKTFMEIGGYAKKIIEVDAQLRSDTIVKMNNGYLYGLVSEYDKQIYKELVQSYVVLNDYLKEKNIPLLYIQTPMKICQYEKELPYGIEDYTNKNIDMALETLKESGIYTIDLRDKLHEQDLIHYDFFYQTDHHWTIDAGLWAAKEIATTISERYGFALDTSLLEKNKYIEDAYENAMFGSLGQSVTHGWADSEDFTVYLPKFTTSFEVKNPDLGMDVTGSFEDTMIDIKTINECVQDGGGYVYESYLYGNRPLTQITNNNNLDGPSILMIRDSFSLAVAPYLAMTASELDLIDLRDTAGNFTGSVQTYIDEMQPDIVLILYSQMVNEEMK